MAKIWKQDSNVSEHPNRNNFDLRYQNHLTMKMGYIYPIMAKECVPGDKFSIDTAFGLKFMPLVFPVQSRMRAHVSYFYVPNRILWKNWKNFISGLEEHVHPYIDQPTEWFKTGSICDYMDVPTTTVGSTLKTTTNVSRSSMFTTGFNGRGCGTGSGYLGNTRGVGNIVLPDVVNTSASGLYSQSITANFLTADPFAGIPYDRFVDVAAFSGNLYPLYFFNRPLNLLSFDPLTEVSFEVFNYTLLDKVYLIFWSGTRDVSLPADSSVLPADLVFSGFLDGELSTANGFSRFTPASSDKYSDIIDYLRSQQIDGKVVYFSVAFEYNNSHVPAIGGIPDKNHSFYFSGRFRYTYDSKSVDTAVTPFANDADPKGEPVIRLNALPFRAYEAIYWSYFSNTQNQQFYVDGQPVYNQWHTTDEDGADSTNYHLFRRNYELDFLTSALPSPQFGVAPLVGMTALGNMTIEDENGISTYQATIDNDGTISKVVATSPTASIEHARTAMNIAQVGMNINDFRAGNAYQRFVERTLRRGYRYIDFIKGHHDVDVTRVELDMPVYIGGVSQDVSVNMISNMSAGQSINGQEIPLGEFAGTANCFGQSRNTVSHYCDDYGWIIGVMCVVPDPAYSQLLPKHFLHDQQLSYYFNEFAQLGLQPITYKEVTPLTAYQDYLFDSSKLLTDTFGYQRPNYDLVGYTDQVHGLFRTELKDFLIHRIFEHRPELGSEFLEIDPKEVNDIFAYRDSDSDTIIGQIILDIKAKRPVPRVVVPTLGR